MRSINVNFKKELQESVPTYLALKRAVKSRFFSRDIISRNFIRLVDKEDYCIDDKNTLIDDLYTYSNTPEEHEIETK